MYMIAEVLQYVAVASFAEAWIEIIIPYPRCGFGASPPSRRRGLKSESIDVFVNATAVASFAEAWIEIRSRGRRSQEK